MSYNIRNIREISNDPLTKFTNQIAKKLAIFLTKQETDKLENKEDIFSNGQDIDSVVRFHNLNSSKYFDFLTTYYPPTEPDNDKVRLWIRGDNLGNTINDISYFNNHGTLFGDPMLVDGTPFNYGIHWGGIKSIALKFNRPTSDNENEEYISVPDDTDIQVSGIATGMSYFIRFKIFSLSTQSSKERTLFEKIDDSTPNNAAIATVSTDGRIKFYLKRGGTWYRNQTAAGTIALDTVYEVFITYAVSGNVSHIWVNNVDKTLTDPGSDPTLHTTLTNHDLSIFRLGAGTGGGHAYADLYDYMIFKEKVVSSTEVGRHYTNKWTLANIPYGQVAIGSYWASYILAPTPSFTTTSFTSSFDV